MEHLHESRTPMAKIFHHTPKTINAVISNPNFISVGEWVEVDADRAPGFNSEGGIAVKTQVHDALVDVKLVYLPPQPNMNPYLINLLYFCPDMC